MSDLPPRDPDAEQTAEPTTEPVEPVAAEMLDPTEWFEPPLVEPVTEPTVPDDYMPPTNDQSGFVDVQAPFVKQPPADGELTIDLVDLDGDQRRLLSYRLTELGIRHRVESDGLIAGTEAATAIHGQIAELFGSEDIEEVIDEADADEDEIVFDLASLSTEERRHLGMRLTGAGIAHIWEVGTDLVVSVADAPVIDSYIGEVRNPEGFADDEIASLEAESDVDDEAIYAAMSNLYVAADKLMQRPGDEATAGEFYLAADDVDGLPAPFGFDPRVWSQVLNLTLAIVDGLDAEADPEAIGDNAKSLRQILVNFV